MIALRNLIIVLLLCVAFATHVGGQEVLSGLQFNTQLQSAAQLQVIEKVAHGNQAPLTLPFFEDFSASRIYPSTTRWVDKHVFVNKDFPIFPPNAGAATFDVLDQNGKVYSHASSAPFIADYLTSQPIRLDSVYHPTPKKLGPADSIYFSFYYQPQGRGDKPEPWDSLVLQFGYPTGRMVLDYVDSITVEINSYLIANNIQRVLPGDTVFSPPGCRPRMFLVSNRIYTWGDRITIPCDSIFKPEIGWLNVWSSKGLSFEEFANAPNNYFKQVFIKVVNPLYFSNLFQFRFFNYGSIASDVNPGARGNVDQWSIDFISLGYNRTIANKHHEKIGFSDRAPSFLKRYETMPYRQYRAAPTVAVKPEISLKIANLSNATKNTKYRYMVKQVNGTQSFGWDGGTCMLEPFSNIGFQSCASTCGAKHACPPVTSLFALNFDIDTTSFIIRHFISDSTQNSILVDSLVYRQGFYNYFAYDDGTPEAGYSLEPGGAFLAQQYRLSTSDTLKSIQLFFNRTLNAGNNKFFDLIVWLDNNGRPGEIVYRKTKQRPIWNDVLFGFHQYLIDKPVVLNGNFYIGIMQEESGSMNIGFDKVNNSKQYLFYNVDGIWNNSAFDGSVLMRPVFGSKKVVGINETANTLQKMRHFPNPASQLIHFETIPNSGFIPVKITLFELTGRAVIVTDFNSTLDISQTPPGIYLLHIEGKDKTIYTSKIVISK